MNLLLKSTINIVFLLTLVKIYEAAESCQLPGGATGLCVKMSSCKPLEFLYNKKHKTEDEKLYLQLSYCTRGQKMKLNYPGYRSTITVRRKVCCPTSDEFLPPTPAISSTPTDEYDQPNCGEENSHGYRIAGGAITKPDQFPWLVLLEYNRGNLGCGGSLISSKLVVTAAHCIDVRHEQPEKARLGEYNTTSYPTDTIELLTGEVEEITVTVIRIESRIQHPQYNSFHTIHDIGVLKLSQEVTFNDFIRTICLPPKDYSSEFSARTNLIVAGWGADPSDPKSNDVKKHVSLPYVPLEPCRRGRRTLIDSQICAGGEDGRDTCMGDSGGPLMYSNKGKFILVGITSYGPKMCGTKGTPGVYTHVYKYVNWINDIMNDRIEF